MRLRSSGLALERRLEVALRVAPRRGVEHGADDDRRAVDVEAQPLGDHAEAAFPGLRVVVLLLLVHRAARQHGEVLLAHDLRDLLARRERHRGDADHLRRRALPFADLRRVDDEVAALRVLDVDRHRQRVQQALGELPGALAAPLLPAQRRLQAALGELPLGDVEVVADDQRHAVLVLHAALGHHAEDSSPVTACSIARSLLTRSPARAARSLAIDPARAHRAPRSEVLPTISAGARPRSRANALFTIT